MKIAVHVDAADRIVDVHAPGRLSLFDDASGCWTVVAEIPFRVEPGASLADVKATLRAAVAGTGDCRTFVSGEARGLVLSLLQEEHGFRVWKAAGAIGDLDLDGIARQDAELAAARAQEAKDRAFIALFASSGGGGCSGGDFDALRKPRRAPSAEALDALHGLTEPLGEGRLRIDLAAVLARYRDANSADVLQPILEARRFTSLEILCDHLPRWFAGKLKALDLAADVTPRGEGLRALVTPPRG